MKWQKIGAITLAVAFLFFLIGETGIAWGVLGIAGVIDLYLVGKHYLWKYFRKGKETDTISQWIQALTANKVIDYTTLIVLSTATGYKIFEGLGFVKGMEALLPTTILFLAIHLFGNKD